MWLDIGGLLNVSVVIGLTMVVILFCGIGVFRSLYRHEVTSKETMQLMKQMFCLLLIQSFFPIAFTFVPSSSIHVMSLFGGDICTRGNVVGILLTLYPVLEPLVILSCDTNYREAIKMYLGVLKYTSNRRCSVSAIKF
ncbi:unnamed protein product [Nippostrongylus brasiliensis]|uniref:G protein-coupled receptor n=1 Tax=Nippostrongylus brasiliensis TaxID=27835 RepID=A0A0N4YJ04_NIPBR|nr:hypothetical protein Q1695_006001 [Nippostrongylus brasiliensis]VDL80515.1 unnamed protein product [Nippostrongylus brasiliensis]